MGRFFKSEMSARSLVVASALISLAIGATALKSLLDARDVAYELARLADGNIVGPMEADIARNIEIYDLSLLAAMEGMRFSGIGQLSPQARQLILFDRSATAKHLGEILVSDVRGRVMYDSRQVNPPEHDISTQDFFRVHQYKSDVGLFIGLPFTTRDGHRVLGISRRLENPDGSFAGVVVGTLKVTFFDDLFQRIRLTAARSITIVHKSGMIVSRAPHSDLIGRSVAESEVFQKLTEASSGDFEATTSYDGVLRLFTFRHVERFPLIVAVAAPVSNIFVAWNAQAVRLFGVLIVLIAAMVGLSLIAAKELRRRAALETKLSKLATTDPLTRLANRRVFDTTLQNEWQRALREKSSIALLMIDADHFKRYNDLYGHQAGDQVLSRIALCVGNSIRSAPDLAARYGGEEFVVLLPKTTHREALIVADRIHHNLKHMTAAMCDHRPVPTVSIGLAALEPKLGVPSNTLIQAADQALYLAKSRGRDRTEIAGEAPSVYLLAV